MLTTQTKNSMNLVFTHIDSYCYNWRLDVRWYNNDNWVKSNLGQQHELQQCITVFDKTFKQLHVIVKSALTFRLYNLTNVHFIDYSRDVHKIDSRLSEFSATINFQECLFKFVIWNWKFIPQNSKHSILCSWVHPVWHPNTWLNQYHSNVSHHPWKILVSVYQCHGPSCDPYLAD